MKRQLSPAEERRLFRGKPTAAAEMEKVKRRKVVVGPREAAARRVREEALARAQKANVTVRGA